MRLPDWPARWRRCAAGSTSCASLPTRVEQLADLVARHAETNAATQPHPATRRQRCPGWTYPPTPAVPPESSRSARRGGPAQRSWPAGSAGSTCATPTPPRRCRSAGCGTPRWSRNCSGCTPPGCAAYAAGAPGPRWGTGTTGNAPAWSAGSATTPACAPWKRTSPAPTAHTPAPVAPTADAVPAIAAWWATRRDRPAAGPHRRAARRGPPPRIQRGRR